MANASLPDGTPIYTGVRFRAFNDTTVRTVKFTYNDILFDSGLRGELGEFGNYFNTWNWEAGFRYSRNDVSLLAGGGVSASGLRDALLDTDPATAFNPFLGIFGRNTQAAITRVYVTEHETATFELPLGYFTVNGDAFNLPAGPVSFALGLEYVGSVGATILTRSALRLRLFGRWGQLRRLTGEPGCLGDLPGSADSGYQPDVEFPRGV